jgi:hypothetical protein
LHYWERYRIAQQDAWNYLTALADDSQPLNGIPDSNPKSLTNFISCKVSIADIQHAGKHLAQVHDLMNEVQITTFDKIAQLLSVA